MKYVCHSKYKNKELNKVCGKLLEAVEESKLKPFDMVFHLLNHKNFYNIISKDGFPQRYPYWLWGQKFESLIKAHNYGRSRIYEKVINSNPCHAYILDSNKKTYLKIAIARIYGHSDFYANNIWYKKTNRNITDRMVDHRSEIIEIINKEGQSKVEEFLDKCYTLDNLIDMQSLKEKKTGKSSNEVKDILGFLIENSPLKDWRKKILSIIREEAYHFCPSTLTKLMDNGWAFYWQEKILIDKLLINKEEVTDYWDYKANIIDIPWLKNSKINYDVLGSVMWKYVEDYFNRGKDSPEYKNSKMKNNWGRDIIKEIRKMPFEKRMHTRGMRKIFEIRESYNDAEFIEEFFTEDFCQEILRLDDEKEYKKIKNLLLEIVSPYEHPEIVILDSNYKGTGELYIKHKYKGLPLKKDWMFDTLKNLYYMYGKKIHLETSFHDFYKNRRTIISYTDVEGFSQNIIEV